jgi:hypothetical protein
MAHGAEQVDGSGHLRAEAEREADGGRVAATKSRYNKATSVDL